MTTDDGDLAARRRRVARRHHPDLGGDPAAFVAAMAELDAEHDVEDDRPGSRSHHHVEIVLSARSRRRRRRAAARRAVVDGAHRLRRLRLPGRRPADDPTPGPTDPNDPHH